jgi:hypothetical protein
LLVLVSAPVGSLPEVAFVPDHAPVAEQEVAFVEDQMSIEEPPLVTDVGFATSDAVGTDEHVAAAGQPSESPLPPPPQPANARASTGTSSNLFNAQLEILIAWPARRCCEVCT